MDIFPDLDIYFGQSTRNDAIKLMKAKACGLWNWQDSDAFGRPSQADRLYFHRSSSKLEPSCTLCILHKSDNHSVVVAIVPDAATVASLTIEQYVRILKDFDETIARLSVEQNGGIASIGTSQHTLEDYFSTKSIELLEHFCLTSNWSDGGSSLFDQKKMDEVSHLLLSK